MDAEWSIIYEKLDRCIQLGANIVLSRLPIGDLATQYFADRGVFCAGRISDEDIKRIERATGAKIQSTVYGVKNDVLGTCGVFEEVQIGSKRYNVFKQVRLPLPPHSSSEVVLNSSLQKQSDRFMTH